MAAVEAQNRLGGRVLSRSISGGCFDLGPAWFWPGQPRIDALINRFGLKAFEQYATGNLIFQDQTGQVHQNRGYASMQGSLRLEGGMAAMIRALAAHLPENRITMGRALTHLHQTDGGIVATVAGQDVTARHIVLALPPRVAAQTITFTPALPQTAIDEMQAIPTWMAGHAKIVAVYDTPHWRDDGFSGDAISHAGPMVEIHDASPAVGGPYALFGFVGLPADVRADHGDAILAQAKQQLVAMFGAAMDEPLKILMQDWAESPHIATKQDWVSPRTHPDYGLPNALNSLWSGHIHLGSTETGQTFGGFLEGALEAAEAVAQRIIR